MNRAFITPRRALAAAALATGLTGMALAALPDTPAGDPPPELEGPHARGLPPPLAALNLSEAQQAKIQALHEAFHQQHEAQRGSERALHESLRNLSPAAPNYTQEVDRIATQMGQAHAQRIREMAALRAQEWALLTPAQQSQLAAMPKPDFRDGPRRMHWHGGAKGAPGNAAPGAGTP